MKGIIPKDREIKDFTLINDDIFWINTTNNKLWSLKKQEFTVSQNYVLKKFQISVKMFFDFNNFLNNKNNIYIYRTL